MIIQYFIIFILIIANTQPILELRDQYRYIVDPPILDPSSTLNSIAIFQQYQASNEYEHQQVSPQEFTKSITQTQKPLCFSDFNHEGITAKAFQLLQERKYKKSLQIYKKELRRCIKIKGSRDSLEIAQIYRMISSIHDKRKKYPKALDYEKRTLKIQKKQLPDEYRFLLARTYSHIASLYQNMGKLKKSLNSYLKAIGILEQEIKNGYISSEYEDLLTTYYNIADLAYILASQKGITQKSLAIETGIFYYQKALAISKIKEETIDVANSYLGIANFYLLDESMDNASSYFCKVIKKLNHYLVNHSSDQEVRKSLGNFQIFYQEKFSLYRCD